MSHEPGYESPLSVRKFKIKPEINSDAVPLAWCENEQKQQPNGSKPFQIDEKCHKKTNANGGATTTGTTAGTIKGLVSMATMQAASTADERVAFINNIENSKSVAIEQPCTCDKKTKKRLNIIRSFIPWGIPWAILTNSFIQVSVFCDRYPKVFGSKKYLIINRNEILHVRLFLDNNTFYGL